MNVPTSSHNIYSPGVAASGDNGDHRLRACSFVSNTFEKPHSGHQPLSRQRSFSSPPQFTGSNPGGLASRNDFTAIDMTAVSGDAIAMPNVASEQPQARSFQTLTNIGTVAARTFASVGVPTATREILRRMVLAPLAASAPTTLNAVAVACGTLPLALQIGALAYDCYQGRQTTQSVCARLGNMLLAGGSMAGLIYSGGLSAAAAPLISAVLVYVPLRDVIQYFLPLSDNVTPEALLPAVTSAAGAYALNQTVVSLSMTELADLLTPLVGPVTANVIAATLINIGGETAEHMTYRQLTAYFTGEAALQIECHLRTPDEITWHSVMDTFTTTFACRSSLFTAGYANSFAIQGDSLLNSATIGATLGAGYPLFVYSAERGDPVASNRSEITAIDIDHLPGKIP